jgi:hypothetical protein
MEGAQAQEGASHAGVAGRGHSTNSFED